MSKVFIYDEFNPQDNAMLQALYSRSALSVERHVEKVRKTGSGKFMEKFYVGYGHSSIADCGSTTIFIEGISILADKAIQDWPLYSGQETSTRYIDMSKQPIVDPINSKESKRILNSWMKFYVSNQEKVCEHIKQKYPKKARENEDVYEKAVRARSFDILRGFLPAGITTQLSWHTNLRQARDKLDLLEYNPILEIKELSEKILKILKEKYPQSFSYVSEKEQEKYRDFIGKKYFYYNAKKPKGGFSFRTKIDSKELLKYKDLINLRPERTGFPHFLAELGNNTFDFLLDFGSFRDIQRHRNGVCRMPLLTMKCGFNKWYLDQLSKDLKIEALKLIKGQIQSIKKLKTNPEIRQYYIALGFNVSCRVSYGLPATTYVIELCSGKAVHPTLRKVAHQMREALVNKFPKIKLHCDTDPDDWDVRRGLQDIREVK